eukprot:11174281-Heterocapsa_arctica.AAC.1
MGETLPEDATTTVSPRTRGESDIVDEAKNGWSTRSSAEEVLEKMPIELGHCTHGGRDLYPHIYYVDVMIIMEIDVKYQETHGCALKPPLMKADTAAAQAQGTQCRYLRTQGRR